VSGSLIDAQARAGPFIRRCETMQRRGFWTAQIVALACAAWSVRAAAQSLPPQAPPAPALPSDVRAGHWAAAQVQEILRNRVLSVGADRSFHGDAKVTHLQAVLALARLGTALEDGTWLGNASVPVTVAKTDIAPKSGAWEGQGVSRYVFAAVLTRMGDYANAGLVRAQPTEKDRAKSIAIPAPVAVTLPKSSPAYDALTYLAGHRMVGAGSALLSADDKPLTAAEMTRALRELVTGLTDRVTDLGHDENGATHDEAFHTKKLTKKN